MKNDRQAKKRADLEMLSTLLHLADQFGPESKQRLAMGAEQLRGAQLANQSQQATLPFLGREAEARVGTVEDQRGYAQQRQPLELAGMGGANRGQELANLFAEKSMPDRLGALGADAALGRQQVAHGDVMNPLAQQQARLNLNQTALTNPLVADQMRLANDDQRMSLRHREEGFGPALDSTRWGNAGQALNFGMMSGQQPDPRSILSQQGLPMPEPAGPADPQEASASFFQTALQLGIDPEDLQALMARRRAQMEPWSVSGAAGVGARR